MINNHALPWCILNTINTWLSGKNLSWFGRLIINFRLSGFYLFGRPVFIHLVLQFLFIRSSGYGLIYMSVSLLGNFHQMSLVRFIILPILSPISSVNTQKLAAYYLQVMHFFKKEGVVFGVQLLVITLQNGLA